MDLETLRGRVLMRLDRFWLDGQGTKEDAIADIQDLFEEAQASPSAASSQEKTESGSTAPRRRRKAAGPSR